MGSGASLAEPFLQFLVNCLCRDERPHIENGILLAVWAVQHVILTNAGGVDGPISVSVLEKTKDNNYSARDLPEYEIVNELTIINDYQNSMPLLLSEFRSGSKAGIHAPPQNID